MKPHALALLLLAAPTVLTAGTLHAGESSPGEGANVAPPDPCEVERTAARHALGGDVDTRIRLEHADRACAESLERSMSRVREALGIGDDAAARKELARVTELAIEIASDLRELAPDRDEPRDVVLPEGRCRKRADLLAAVSKEGHDRALDTELQKATDACDRVARFNVQVANVYLAAEQFENARAAAERALAAADGVNAKVAEQARLVLRKIDRAPEYAVTPQGLRLSP